MGMAKRLIVCIIYFICSIFLFQGIVFAETGDPAIDTLIKKMEEKGVVDKEEAKKLEEDVKKAVKERDKKIAKDIKLPFNVRMVVQPRFQSGDLLVGNDGKYKHESDLYM